MKETISAIINYLNTQNGGDLFFSECGRDYDAPHCRDGCIPLVKCQVCTRRYMAYKTNKDYLDHIGELYKKETK